MRRALALLAAVAAPVVLTPAGPAQAADTLDGSSVVLTVTDVAPNTPIASAKDRPLTFSLTAQNTTGEELTGLSISADRLEPIGNQGQLDDRVSGKVTANPTYTASINTDPVAIDLPASASLPITFATTTSTINGTGLCLCADAIYPVEFVATYTDADGVATVVGRTTTYLPSFGTPTVPNPLKLSWIWPLLAPPHRLNSTKLFLDDELTDEVKAGGRLDNALQVLERVAGRVPMTVVTDPELLDELEVMASGTYRVFAPTAKPRRSVVGTGGTVARAWLDRFTALLNDHPDLQLELTPFADPDVEALQSNSLTWTNSLADPGTEARLSDALGTRTPQRTLDWPYGATLSPSTLAVLVRRGTDSAVLTDRGFAQGRDDADLDALSEVRTSEGTATAVVTSAALQARVLDVLQTGGHGLAALPELVSQLAMRVVEHLGDGVSRYVALAAPRDLDVDPDLAVRAVLATADRFWVDPMTVSTAIADPTITRSSRGELSAVKVRTLPTATVSTMRGVVSTLPGLTGTGGLFDVSAIDAKTPDGATSSGSTDNGTSSSSGTSNNGTPSTTSKVLTTIAKVPTGLQRTVACGLLDEPKVSAYRAGIIAKFVNSVRAAVHLVKPAGNASYTLTSANAPLPVTVANPLDTDVVVRISVFADGNRPGLDESSVTRRIPAGTTQQERVDISIDLSGVRIGATVSLSTASEKRPMTLGDGNLRVSVRNTALGTVGAWITTVAAIILGLALLFRLYRAIRWRRRRGVTTPAELDPLSP